MSIESIIIVFSLGLLTVLAVFFIAGLIYSKINKTEPEYLYDNTLQKKQLSSLPTAQAGLSKYTSPARLTNYPHYNSGQKRSLSNGNYNFNGQTHPVNNSLYTVVNSSQQIPYLHNQRFNKL